MCAWKSKIQVSILLAALFGLAETAVAAKVLIPVDRDAGGVPIECVFDSNCHNRFHPDITAVATANPGDTVVFETRDAFDNQFNFATVPTDIPFADISRVHPLTGPLFVNGGEVGDILEVTIVKVEPDASSGNFGYTIGLPGFGFLRDLFPAPFIARWSLTTAAATSSDMPANIRIPSNGFPGTIGVAPDQDLLSAILAREAALEKAGGFVLLPSPINAAPVGLCGSGALAEKTCVRTIPPRENGGNMDVKGMVAGTRLLFFCFVPGCLLSIGDVHYAQGDGEVSGTALEMNAVVTVKVDLREDQGFLLINPNNDRPRPAFEGGSQFKQLAPEAFFATLGYPLKRAGEGFPQTAHAQLKEVEKLENLAEDLTLAARDALVGMIAHLVTVRGLTEDQAYILSSVAVDLRIGQLVDVPNFGVYAVLPLDVFVP